jgi:hypothetical protein
MIWATDCTHASAAHHRSAHADLNVCKVQLFDYAANRALEEIQEMESTLHAMQVRLPAQRTRRGVAQAGVTRIGSSFTLLTRAE